MSFTGGSRVPATPTLPQGETVASYSTYLEAQRAVDVLSDKQFPVQYVTIVGTDLKMVERVTGRLSYSRAALSGFLSGVWFGIFIGLLFMLTSAATGILFVAMLVGGGFGLLFGVVGYALTGRKRDFTSQSQIVAAQYAVLCAVEKAGDARSLLREAGAIGGPAPVAAPRPVDTSVPPQYGQYAPRQGAPAGQPQYGQYATTAPVASAPVAAPTPARADAPAAQPAEPQYGQYAATATPAQPAAASAGYPEAVQPAPTGAPAPAPAAPAAPAGPQFGQNGSERPPAGDPHPGAPTDEADPGAATGRDDRQG